MKRLVLMLLFLSSPINSAELYCTGSLTSTATMKIIIADGRVTIIPIKAPEKKK